jgi:AAA domain
VIIWVNGTFGAGKTTTATYLAGRLANARHFDPEQVGYLLMRTLGDHEFRDFQDLPPWRELVPVFTGEIARFTGQHLIAVQTVLREDYWRELTEGFKRAQLDVFHVLLHVDSDVLAERITADEGEAGASARQWRLDHISEYEKARPWMESAADLVIDATRLPAADVGERIAVEAEKRMAQAPSLSRGICVHAVAERARYQEAVAAQGGVEGTLPPRPVLERARRRIHGLMREMDGFDLPHRHVDVELDAGPRNGLASCARNCGSDVPRSTFEPARDTQVSGSPLSGGVSNSSCQPARQNTAAVRYGSSVARIGVSTTGGYPASPTGATGSGLASGCRSPRRGSSPRRS